MNMSVAKPQIFQIRNYQRCKVCKADGKRGIYGVFNQVERSKQPGEKCEGICHRDLWRLF